MMDLSKRRTSPSNVVAGSVWETRMKMDEGKGGIKVASDEQEDMVVGLPLQVNKVLEPTHSGGVREKRKTWKQEPIEVIGGIPVQVRQPGSHHYKLFSESVDASEKSYPIYIDKTRSLFDRLDLDEDFVYDHGEEEEEEEEDELGKKGFDVKEVEVPLPFSATVQKLTPEADIEHKCTKFVKDGKKLDKPRTSSPNVVKQAPEFDVLEEKPKKVKDERRKTWKPEPVEVIGGKPIQVRKHRSDSHKFSKSVDGIENNPIYMKKSRSLFHRNRRYDVDVNDFDEEEEEEVVEKEIEQLERKSFDVKEVEQSIPISINSNMLIPEIDISELKPKKVEKEEKRLDQVFEEIMPNSAAVLKITPEFSISDEKPKKVLKEEKRLHQVFEKPMPISANGMKLIPEVDLSEQKPKKIVKEEKRPIAVSASVRKQTPETGISERKAKKAVKDEKKLYQIHEKPIPIPANVKSQLISSRNHLPADHNSFESHHPIRYPERFSPTENILQHIVDLVMWSDVTKSALVFGLGTFILISSYCIEDLKLSFMSAFCYLGLVCLAAIFGYNSALCRLDSSLYDASEVHLVGEEEAILLLKTILPYFNRFLLKLTAIFYGDLATTMKVAVLLFVLAKYGSSINTSEIVKLGFFGAFIVPKLISSYSPKLMTYSRHFQDYWHSCPHKKYMVLIVFILVWSLSSMVTRIWAVFMLVLAGRYYQQLLMKEDWAPYDEAREDTISSRQGGRRHADRVN